VDVAAGVIYFVGSDDHVHAVNFNIGPAGKLVTFSVSPNDGEAAAAVRTDSANAARSQRTRIVGTPALRTNQGSGETVTCEAVCQSAEVRKAG
jgi:hypothetical protein